MAWKTDTLTGWGRVLSGQAEIARPEKPSAIARVMADTPAPAVGAQRSYGDAAINTDGKAIDMNRLDRFISFDAETGVLEAEAGVSITQMLQTFAPQGWIPTVMPGQVLPRSAVVSQTMHTAKTTTALARLDNTSSALN